MTRILGTDNHAADLCLTVGGADRGHSIGGDEISLRSIQQCDPQPKLLLLIGGLSDTDSPSTRTDPAWSRPSEEIR
jgi:hypothetical protein